jgi:hypothetical protein
VAVALVLTILLVSLAAAPRAGATTLTYVKGKEVWVSTLDGKKKKRLSSGQGDWRQVAAADNGRILGLRLQAGKISQLSRIQLWSRSGRVLSRGPLPYKFRSWSLYAAPIGMDLSADGRLLAFGFSGYTGVVPNASFFDGYHVVSALNKLVNVDFELNGEWPSMYGRQAVVADGSTIVVQRRATAPFGSDYDPIIETAGTGLNLNRSDVSANGRLLAFELRADLASVDRIGLVSISGVTPPVTVGARVDCFLPAVGDARDVTLSQDGSRIAWADRQGVKVAGVPKTLGSPCRFSSRPKLIARNATSPSIGAASFRDLAR